MVYIPLREWLAGHEQIDLKGILPQADLDRILVAVHNSSASGSQREVILDLPHSVLEGLRVKLNLTASGRMTADFITSDEKIRALLDLHSHGLSDLLRARGLNLERLRTSLNEDQERYGDQDSQRERRRRRDQNDSRNPRNRKQPMRLKYPR